MTCKSCAHSIGLYGVLWCQLLDGPATSQCRQFVYEPGTDEGQG